MKSKKQKSPHTRIKATVLAVLMLTAATLLPNSKKSDDYIRARIFLLSSKHGSCSGEQVHAASGIDYILSAAHCRILEEDGYITVTSESGRILQRRVIAEDINSDLLLLEGVPNLRGLDIAESSRRGDIVTTFTRGAGLPTYKTEGVIITDIDVHVGISEIETAAQSDACESMPKNKVMPSLDGNDVCVLVAPETVSNAMIVPGSSGGSLLNSNRELVGVASAGDGRFGFFVRLVDIQKFLRNY